MASNYTGNPIAAQAPSPAPTLGSNTDGDPVMRMPTDGDALNASSLLQDLKVAGDWIAFFRRVLKPFKGVTEWSNLLTYSIGDMVLAPNGKTYRAIAGSTNQTPASYPGAWELWGHSNADLVLALAALYPITGTPRGKYFALPGGLVLQVETLLSESGHIPTGAGGTSSYSFEYEFPNACYAAFFIPITLSDDHNLGMPAVLASVTSKAGCNLSLVYQGASANGYVKTGYLISFGS